MATKTGAPRSAARRMTAARGRTSFGAAISGTRERRTGDASVTRAAARPLSPSEAIQANRIAMSRRAAGMIVSATHSGRPKERTFPCSRSALTRPTLAHARTAQTAAATEKEKRRASAPGALAAEELGGGEGEVLALARREEAADEGGPERDELEDRPGARDVEPAERAPEGVEKGEDRRDGDRRDEEPLLAPPEEDAGRHFRGAVAFFARYSARILFASSNAACRDDLSARSSGRPLPRRPARAPRPSRRRRRRSGPASSSRRCPAPPRPGSRPGGARPASAAAARIAFWSAGEIRSQVGFQIIVAPRRTAHFTSVMFFACWYHWRRTAACGVVGRAETSPVWRAVEISVDGSGTGLNPASFQISM